MSDKCVWKLIPGTIKLYKNGPATFVAGYISKCDGKSHNHLKVSGGTCPYCGRQIEVEGEDG